MQKNNLYILLVPLFCVSALFGSGPRWFYESDKSSEQAAPEMALAHAEQQLRDEVIASRAQIATLAQVLKERMAELTAAHANNRDQQRTLDRLTEAREAGEQRRQQAAVIAAKLTEYLAGDPSQAVSIPSDSESSSSSPTLSVLSSSEPRSLPLTRILGSATRSESYIDAGTSSSASSNPPSSASSLPSSNPTTPKRYSGEHTPIFPADDLK